ncbi:MAG: hypothetical protein N3D82_05030 [Ignisphaera sp.]|nr:hypothetical protein [Ignisphaera sp.]MCX8168371.1 hypothetical protein [Ignisphaera sp.]MDW8086180.1 hypothetical protein [Ignisphaera sp.]
MKKIPVHVILALLLVTVVVLAAAALYVRSILEIDVKGSVDVKPSTTVVDVKLDIYSREGEEVITLGTINIPTRGSVIARSKLVNYEGNITLVISGELQLDSHSRQYRIVMPCLASIGEPCYRIAVIIPGYDEPLDIEEGAYNATLVLRWIASGLGKFHLKLYLGYSEAPTNLTVDSEERPYVKVVGIKPESADGWTAAHNSTKSYSMLISNTSSTTVMVWIWIYDPNSINENSVTFKLVDHLTGNVIVERIIEMFRDGIYWSVLLEVEIPSEGMYRLACLFRDTLMSSVIIVN